jgi:hypothetical protein
VPPPWFESRAAAKTALERFPTGRNRLVDKKSLQIQNAGAISSRKSLSTFSDFVLAAVLTLASFALTGLADAPALAQSAAPARKPRPLPPISAPAPPSAQIDFPVPAGRAPVFRGGFAEREGAAPSIAANFGAPRPRTKLPKPYPPRRVGVPAPFSPRTPLPRLEAYRTAAVARTAVRLRPGAPPPYPPPVTVAVEPTIKVKPRPKVELKPYDPLGIGIGSLRLSPFIEGAFGYDTNPNRLSSRDRPNGSRVFRTDGGFALKSEWARHEFNANLRMGYAEYFDVPLASRPDGIGAFNARYDVTRDTGLLLGGRFSLDTQRPGAPALSSGLPNVNVVNRPIVFSFGVSPGIVQKFNRLELTLRGSFDRTTYQNAAYTDGTSLNLSLSDYNAYGVSGRAAYELTPDVKPFVEATADRRVLDSTADLNGYRRNSVGLALRGGAAVAISDLLKGEASAGYAERSYADPRLVKLRGPTIDAALIYTPTPLTTVTLRATTTLSETQVSGASGALARSFSAQVSHELLRNLTITGIGTYSLNNYQGIDLKERSYSAGVRLEYKITRSIAIRGSYMFERLKASGGAYDYTANVYLVGLRLQL